MRACALSRVEASLDSELNATGSNPVDVEIFLSSENHSNSLLDASCCLLVSAKMSYQ